MSANTVNQLLERLVHAGALTEERFSALLGAPLKPGESSPFWQGFTFELMGGPFARGELRLDTAGDGALLILEPRDPPGLGQGDVDGAALGPRLGMQPNPHIPPEGIHTETFQKDGVQVALQWTSRSRRLHSLVLEWQPPAAAGTPPAGNGSEEPPSGTQA
jgi:hypothetical protein